MPFPAACCLRDWEALSNTGASATQRSRFFSERASGSSAASNAKTGMALRPSRSKTNPPEFRSSRAPFIPVTGFPSPCASLSPLVPPLGPSGQWGTGALSAQPRRGFLPAHSFFFPLYFSPEFAPPIRQSSGSPGLPVTRRDERRQGGIPLEADGELLSSCS